MGFLKPGDEWSSYRLDVSKKAKLFAKSRRIWQSKKDDKLLAWLTFETPTYDTFGMDTEIPQKSNER